MMVQLEHCLAEMRGPETNAEHIALSTAVSLKRIADTGADLLNFLERHSFDGSIQVRVTGVTQ